MSGTYIPFDDLHSPNDPDEFDVEPFRDDAAEQEEDAIEIAATGEQDMQAAIDYVYNLHKKPIIILGSSYSASLALKEAKENPKISAVIAYSPGEYFGKGYSLADTIAGLNKLGYVTSAKSETASVTALLHYVDHSKIEQYLPQGNGVHGAKTLWSSSADHDEYWHSLETFVEKLKTKS